MINAKTHVLLRTFSGWKIVAGDRMTLTSRYINYPQYIASVLRPPKAMTGRMNLYPSGVRAHKPIDETEKNERKEIESFNWNYYVNYFRLRRIVGSAAVRTYTPHLPPAPTRTLDGSLPRPAANPDPPRTARVRPPLRPISPPVPAPAHSPFDNSTPFSHTRQL